MIVSGSTLQYLLAREFGTAECDSASRRSKVGHPLLFDASSDMRGHVVLVPPDELPGRDEALDGALCVCMTPQSAQAARASGVSVVEVGDGASFAQVCNAVQRMYMAAEAFDARLRAYVEAQAGFQALFDACEETTGCACALFDEHYQRIFQSAPAARESEPETASEGVTADGSAAPAAGALFDSDAIDALMASRSYHTMRASRNVYIVPGAGDVMLKNVFAEGRLVGTLVMGFAGDAVSARFVRNILNYLCPYVEEMHARIGAFETSAVDVGRVKALLNDAVAGDVAAVVRLQEALADTGRSGQGRYVVVRIERSFTHEGSEGHDYLAHRFESAWPGAYSFVADGNLYLFSKLGGSDSQTQQDFLRELPVFARENLSKTGVSRPFTSMQRLAGARLQADGAFECGSELDPTNWCYRYEDYALEWLLLRASRHAPSKDVGHPALETLERYDEEHGSDLLGTLLAFMNCRYNATAAADELFVARSTLLNRLERVRELTGLDLDDTHDRFYLALTLAMSEVERRLWREGRY